MGLPGCVMYAGATVFDLVLPRVMTGEKPVAEGEAVRIMTGAPIPNGCDCVLRQEDTDYGEVVVEIYHSDWLIRKSFCGTY